MQGLTTNSFFQPLALALSAVINHLFRRIWSLPLLALVLLDAPKGASAAPWNVTFGGCSFSGDSGGSPLVRTGSCPSQAGILDLGRRFITSLPVNAFEGMGQMTMLFLGNNLLRALPATLFNGTTSLWWVELAGNQLVTLPAGLFAGIYSVDLSHNALSTLPAGVFSGLGAQSYLDLSGNALKCVPLSSEIFLRIYSDNLLWNYRPGKIQAACTSLPWTVTFGNCSFSGDYAGAPLVRAGSCPSQAGSLDLRSKFITSLPANAFEGMAQMTELYLSGNQLSALPANLFVGLNSLTHLNLDNNQLSALTAGVFSGLGATRRLDLSHNTLSTLPANLFAGLNSLTDLKLDNNQLSALTAGVFSGLGALITSLGSLDLSHNALSTLPADVFVGLGSSITYYLDLSWNALKCVPLSSETRLVFSYRTCTCTSSPWTVTFGNCIFSGDYAGAPLVRAGSCPSQAGSLDLSGKFITSLPANAFEGMAQMTEVDLSYNQLSALPANLFVGLNSLTHLNLDHNQLSALTAGVFSGLGALDYLDLSHNTLSTLPVGAFSGISRAEYNAGFDGMVSVQERKLALYLSFSPPAPPLPALALAVSSGKLSLSGEIPSGSERKLSQKNFDCGSSRSLIDPRPNGDFCDPCLGDCACFVVLDRDGDHLLSREEYEAGFDMFDIDKDDKISLITLSGLRLDDNQLTTLPENVFSGLISLSTLQLHHNRLSALPSGVFLGLISLRRLLLNVPGDFGNFLSTWPGNQDGHFGTGNNLDCVPLSAQQLAGVAALRTADGRDQYGGFGVASHYAPQTLCVTSTVAGSTPTSLVSAGTPTSLGSADTPTSKPTSQGNTGVEETTRRVIGAVVGAFVVCFTLAACFYVTRRVRGKSQIHNASALGLDFLDFAARQRSEEEERAVAEQRRQEAERAARAEEAAARQRQKRERDPSPHLIVEDIEDEEKGAATGDRDVPEMPAQDLDQEPKAIGAGSFKEVFRAQL